MALCCRRFFSPFGSELRSPASLLSALLQCRAAYVFEGGAWVWPGIRVGHRRVLQSISQSSGADGLVAMTTMALQPLVFLVEPLLSEDECEWIVRSVEPSMERSVVAHVSETDADRAWDAEKRRERRMQAEQSRTSTQARMALNGNSKAIEIEERAHAITRIPYLLRGISMSTYPHSF